MSLGNFVNPWEVQDNITNQKVLNTRAISENVLFPHINKKSLISNNNKFKRINGTKNIIIFFGIGNIIKNINTLLSRSSSKNWDYSYLENLEAVPRFMREYKHLYDSITNLVFIDHSSFNETQNNHSLRFGYNCDNTPCTPIRVKPANLNRARTDPEYIIANRNSNERHLMTVLEHLGHIVDLQAISELMSDNGNFIHLGCGAGWAPDIGNEIHSIIGHKLNLYLNGDVTSIGWKVWRERKTKTTRQDYARIEFFNQPVTAAKPVENSPSKWERNGTRYHRGFYLWERGTNQRKQLNHSLIIHDGGSIPFSLSDKIIVRVLDNKQPNNIVYYPINKLQKK